MNTFTDQDKQVFSDKQISENQIIEQVNRFKKGFPYINLKASATLDNGIIKLDEAKLKEMISFFDENKDYYDIVKFVPASGAATRMFKELYAFIEDYKGKNIPENFFASPKPDSAAFFFQNIKRFAFYEELKAILDKQSLNIDQLIQTNNLVPIAEALLSEHGLNYGKLPKALIRFHSYPEGNRLAIEEHFVEAAQYAENKGIAQLHFTVSSEHLNDFKKNVANIQPKYENLYGVEYKVSYSVQKPSTDTIAVDLNNELFRDDNGKLLFRPAGHGALIENLNDLQKEIIFIKNIDNVVPDQYKGSTIDYKKAIGGYLLWLQQQCFEYLFRLDDGDLSQQEIINTTEFAHNLLMIDIPDYFNTYSDIEKIDWLYTKLNRPMRVCGMVKNEGEPGGGPYWVSNEMEELSLQIVESSQINHNNAKQEAIFRDSSHFNPVDLVCATMDFSGEPFNLLDFVDKNTGFISRKSKDGRDLKALELPGLWNGAMSDWITIFVEVPVSTFNPVKTVNDLLRENHQ